MSYINHRRPFNRQTSLQTPPPSNRTTTTNLPSNKPPLIGILRNKQRSEELPDHERSSIRIALGGGGQQNRAKSALGPLSNQKLRNGVVKVAWGDDLLINDAVGEGLAKEVVVLRRSERGLGLVLNSRKQLAERLRMAWHEPGVSSTKRNLNIIVTPPIIDSAEDGFIIGTAPMKDDEECVTKIICSSKKNETSAIVVDVTNILHRTLQDEPSRSNNGEESSRAILIIGNRSNAAFNNNMDQSLNVNVINKPTKLVRASSVPAKRTTGSKMDQQPSPNIVNTIPKRRRKASLLLMRRNNKSSTAVNNHSDGRLHVGDMASRHVYQHSKDIVTMVSLLSPNLTDNEDDLDIDDGGGGDGHFINDKIVIDKGQQEHQFNSLRKTVKSVSFQQSSIHSVRSFCASFPGRRGSVGTTGSTYSVAVHQQKKKPANVLLINATSSVSGNKLQEKRGSFSEGNEDGAKPKRRLVRTVSDSNDGCYITSDMMTTPSNETKAQTLASEIPLSPSGNTADGSQQLSTSVETAVQTVSDKEAYCLNTYRKLTESGINISLETILRGMLTPTEYRLRCKREEMEGRQDGRQDGAGGAEESDMALSNK